ncbi:MAG: tRNA 5-methoxyuridine(34)/uridine 5-oxyacetic acid(34) synthase CmoB, partial [Xanthomonadaceae bacterium]|nr:tRNA 5-methoxyuridine(34)/uridine 5-oxyacetic acid(34) synthase CmoB [Xanthomonadaceae bacterium]
MTSEMSGLSSLFNPECAALLKGECARAVAPGRHGDLAAWRAALDALPEAITGWRIESGVLVAGRPVADRRALALTLKKLLPWRKGPLRLGGVAIDTEWRSDWKWDRVGLNLTLAGQRVLDIGAGNGYFGWRMLADGAAGVVGCDPTLVFYMQYRAIEHFAGQSNHLLLPLKFEQIPARADFDTVFSMGVLYHRRDPVEHLERIAAHLKPGGRLLLETLVIADDSDHVLALPGRYANMRNVHPLPTVRRLCRWLRQAGYRDVELIDQTVTGCDEQRATEW